MSEILTVLIWVAKATALLMIALGITMGLRRAPAGARYLVWLGTLAALLLVPAVSSWSPLPLPILPSITVAPIAPSPAPVAAPAPAARMSRDGAASAPTPEIAPARSELSAAAEFLVAWGLVAALLAGWLLLGAVAVRLACAHAGRRDVARPDVRRRRPAGSRPCAAARHERGDRDAIRVRHPASNYRAADERRAVERRAPSGGALPRAGAHPSP